MEYATASGFRDVIGEEACERERIAGEVQRCFAAQGYQPIETPTLEVMDVMRAAGRMPGSPFKFYDAEGDLLAMRPDVTLQVARMCATRLADEAGPLRFRYMQRVFREAEGRMQAQAREMTQIGVECVGEAGPRADAEVVGLMGRALKLAGVHDFRLALASVGVLRALLAASGAPAWWTRRVLEAFHASNYVEIDRLTAPSGAADLESSAAPALAAIRTLPRIRGGREAVLAAREVLEPLGCAEGLDDLARTCELLAEAGLAARILVDFSVVSSFDYYTGIVFEAYSPRLGAPLGSGGRYDNTISSFGAHRPAAGFALSLERAMAAADAPAAPGVPAASGTVKAAPRRPAAAPAPVGPAAATACSVRERPLRIAVPKGSLFSDSVAALEAAGLDVAGLACPGRQLVVRNPGVEYVIVRPTDAPAFVALGAADCGICGKDSLAEDGSDVVELVDLGFGACRFVVAEPAGASGAASERLRRRGSIRVATKYPNVARAHYAKTATQVEIVKLHGNIELAPLTGLAERIVDITATGTSLRENDLVVVDEVLSSTARFFSNACAFRTDARIVELAQSLQQGAAGPKAPQPGTERE